MFVFGADPFRACSGLDMVGRQFVLGANLYRACTGLDMDRLPYYSASSAQHLEQYLKVVGCWRHSQQAIQPSTWSGASSYLAPTFAELVPDSTWTGTTDRLPYYSLLMFVFGASHYQACSGLDINGRHW